VSFLRKSHRNESLFEPFVAFRRSLGYVPNLFQAQTLRPDVVRAETDLYDTIVTKNGALSRRQKECIMLVASVANLSSYCIAGHSEMLRHIDLGGVDPDDLAADHRSADIPEGDKALLDFVEKLTRRPDRMTRDDIEALRGQGFVDAQILEAVQVTALSAFLNCLAAGLGTVPDASRQQDRPEE
jgi:uncharacterized peroxidase-related enzyme